MKGFMRFFKRVSLRERKIEHTRAVLNELISINKRLIQIEQEEKAYINELITAQDTVHYNPKQSTITKPTR